MARREMVRFRKVSVLMSMMIRRKRRRNLREGILKGLKSNVFGVVFFGVVWWCCRWKNGWVVECGADGD